MSQTYLWSCFSHTYDWETHSFPNFGGRITAKTEEEVLLKIFEKLEDLPSLFISIVPSFLGETQHPIIEKYRDIFYNEEADDDTELLYDEDFYDEEDKEELDNIRISFVRMLLGKGDMSKIDPKCRVELYPVHDDDL